MSLVYSQDFSKICWRVKIWSVLTKTALGVIQLWFNYFMASFFKAHGNVNVNYLKIVKKHRGPHKRSKVLVGYMWAMCLRPLL